MPWCSDTIELVYLGAFFAALRVAKNRAIRSNFFPFGAKIPLLSFALRQAPQSLAGKQTHISNVGGILVGCKD
jgi:hypothetical protein